MRIDSIIERVRQRSPSDLARNGILGPAGTVRLPKPILYSSMIDTLGQHTHICVCVPLAGNPPVLTSSRPCLRSQGGHVLEVPTYACKTPFSPRRFNPALAHVPSRATPARTRRTAGKLARHLGKIHCSACNQGRELFSMSVRMRKTTLDVLSFKKPASRVPRN